MDNRSDKSLDRVQKLLDKLEGNMDEIYFKTQGFRDLYVLYMHQDIHKQRYIPIDEIDEKVLRRYLEDRDSRPYNTYMNIEGVRCNIQNILIRTNIDEDLGCGLTTELDIFNTLLTYRDDADFLRNNTHHLDEAVSSIYEQWRRNAKRWRMPGFVISKKWYEEATEELKRRQRIRN